VHHKDLAARIVRLTPRRRPTVTPTVRLGLALGQVHPRAIPATGLHLLTTAAARIRRPHTIRIVPIRTATAVIPHLALTTTIRPRGATPLLAPTLRLITPAAVAIVGAVPEASMAAVAEEAFTAVAVVAPMVAVEADRTAAVVAITKFKS